MFGDRHSCGQLPLPPRGQQARSAYRKCARCRNRDKHPRQGFDMSFFQRDDYGHEVGKITRARGDLASAAPSDGANPQSKIAAREETGEPSCAFCGGGVKAQTLGQDGWPRQNSCSHKSARRTKGNRGAGETLLKRSGESDRASHYHTFVTTNRSTGTPSGLMAFTTPESITRRLNGGVTNEGTTDGRAGLAR